MAQPHIPYGQVFALPPLGAQIGNSKTTALFKGEQLEVVRLVLLAGKTLREHQAPGEITLQGMEGRLELVTSDRRHVLEAGDFIHLRAGEPHALHALSDASVLLTMVIHPRA